MTGTGLLDTDMTTLARSLRGGWDWWLEELGSMAPAGWRQRFAPRPAVVAMVGADGVALTRKGVAVAAPRRGHGLSAVVAVPASAGLTRELWLPLLGQRDLARLVALDLDRLMPFPAASAVVDHRVLLRDPGNRRQLVAIAALPRSVGEAALAAAADAGVTPAGLGLAQPDGSVRFNFLPALADGRAGAGARARRFWWGIVAGGLLLNLIVLVVRDVETTRTLETLVSEHGETARLARTLRNRVVGEEARRQALAERRNATDPLALLADVTRLLPDSAWVQRLGWTGRQLRLGGFSAGSGDVAAELRRAPRFAAARSTASEIAPKSRAGQPFDVTVDVAARR